MTDFDDLLALEQELGPSLRAALRHAADRIPREPPLDARWLSATAAPTPAVSVDNDRAPADSVRDVSETQGHRTEVVVIDLQSVRSESNSPHHGRLNRRRVVTAAAAVVVLVIGTVVARAIGHDGRTEVPSDSGPTVTIDRSPYVDRFYVPKPAAEAVPLGAPLVVGPDAASTLLGSWGQIHDGYVFVYGDGRVLWYPDEGVAPPVPNAAAQHVVLDRRLTARGLELVRRGEIPLADFVHMLRTPLSWYDVWAAPVIKNWEPTHYAICHTAPEKLDAPLLIDRLPAPAQALLRGRQRTYDPTIGTAHWRPPDKAPTEAAPPMECFEVTNEESSTLYRIFEAEGLTDLRHRFPQSWAATIEKDSQDGLQATPIFPHGQPVIFGG